MQLEDSSWIDNVPPDEEMTAQLKGQTSYGFFLDIQENMQDGSKGRVARGLLHTMEMTGTIEEVAELAKSNQLKVLIKKGKVDKNSKLRLTMKGLATKGKETKSKKSIDVKAVATEGKETKSKKSNDVKAVATEGKETKPKKSNDVKAVATEGKETKSKKSNEFTVHLKKMESDSRLGVDMVFFSDHLNIGKINDGLVMEWNKGNPDKEVRPDDKVMDVNGIKGDAAQMIEACKNQDELELLILRE